MQKKILILSKKIDRTLHEHLKIYSVNDIYYSSYSSLSFTIEAGKVVIYDNENDLFLDQYSLVYFKQYRVETKACIVFLQDRNIPFLNKDLGNNLIFDKLAQYVKLGLSNFPIPKSFYGSHKNLIENASNFDYPLILKSITTSRGKDNYLIKDSNELIDTLSKCEDVPFVIQEYIPNQFDYRILILGFELGTALRRIRQNENDHRNNAALGAIEEEDFEPDNELVNLSIEVSYCLNKHVAGVDLIRDSETGKIYVIEVNSKPLFTYDRNISSEVPQFTKFIDSNV